MAEASVEVLKPKDKISSYHLVMMACLVSGGIVIACYVPILLVQLKSYHLPKDLFSEDVICRDEMDYKFTGYLKRFGKNYSPSEYQKRFKIFKASVADIQMMNDAHNGSAVFGFTKFSDWSREEFGIIPIDGEKDFHPLCNHSTYQYPRRQNMSELPRKVDWRVGNFVNKVLDQGRCKSCWAHCVVGIMESMVMISKPPKSDQYSQLSIQELIDCSTDYTGGWCNPGNPINALNYLCHRRAIVPASQYPLTNKEGACRVDNQHIGGVVITKYGVEFNVSPERIVQIVAEHGPVTTSISSWGLQHYRGGVITYHCSGDEDMLDHVVQVVGYNRDAEIPHFILRNSWGTDFGDEGYLYTAMNGACGVGNQITFVDVDII